MANFDINGMTLLINDFDGLADVLPSVAKSMLEVEAEILEPELKRSIEREDLVQSRELKRSIGHIVKRYKGEVRAVVGPSGEHHRYVPSGRRIGADGIVRSGHVGYIHNYGIRSRGIPATKWLEKGVERGSGKAIDAAEKIYNDYLDKHNL